MAIAHALRMAGSALRRNPIIIGFVVVISLLQLPTQFAQVAEPFVATAVSLVFTVVTVLVVPFIFGGLLGMANEALDGPTRVNTFVENGKRYYKSMLGAYLLLLGGAVLVGFVGALASIIVTMAVLIPAGTLSGASGPAFVVAVLASMGVFLLFLLAPLFFVQFYGQAIVIDGETAIDGFKRSVSLVRGNLVSVFGYTILVFGAGLVFGFIGSIPSLLLSVQTTEIPTVLSPPELSLPIIVTLAVVANVLLGAIGSLFLTFSVAFYRSLTPTSNIDEPDTAQGMAS